MRHIIFRPSTILHSTCMSLKAYTNFPLGYPIVTVISISKWTYHIPYEWLSNFNFSLSYSLYPSSPDASKLRPSRPHAWFPQLSYSLQHWLDV